ncbi:DUF1496 domain-containing protein [Herbaspirillum robiniae]|uniref:DUF1496 domain-containing protein n=1 Tax=Herbaspirillum robiniae TaxID=2014887 RepID=UPI003D7883D2
MSENVEVRGDVAQLIGGNVHEAPRQNNVVNFNVGSDKGPVQTLTDLQRKRIAGLVRELCAITQEDTLDVYRVILTEFGAERMKDMPREKYHEVVAQVERWIVENKQGTSKPPPEAITAVANETVKSVAAQIHHCDTCSEKDISYARLQRVSRGQWALSAILAAGCGLLLYKMPAQADAAPTGEHHCFYEGKPYSAGSTIKGGGGTLRECTVDASSGQLSWIKPR